MAHKKRSRHEGAVAGVLSSGAAFPGGDSKKKLEIVLKCDTFGTAEAISTILKKVTTPDVDLRIIHSGVGPVSKSDLLMALTGSKLLVCFQVGTMPKVDQWAKEHGVEVRIYDVIYRLVEDMRSILQSFSETAPEEKILGRGKIIALFKTAKGIILGCEVQEGSLITGKPFRVIAAMGPVYVGRIESLHIEKSVVKEARKGQQVGIKVTDFKNAKIGDLIESFEAAASKGPVGWRPSGNIIYVKV